MAEKYKGWSLRLAINALLRENAKLRRRLIALMAKLEGK